MKTKKHNPYGDIIQSSLYASAGSIALGSIGGTSALHGQQALNNTTRFLPVQGTIAGSSMLLGQIKKIKY